MRVVYDYGAGMRSFVGAAGGRAPGVGFAGGRTAGGRAAGFPLSTAGGSGGGESDLVSTPSAARPSRRPVMIISLGDDNHAGAASRPGEPGHPGVHTAGVETATTTPRSAEQDRGGGIRIAGTDYAVRLSDEALRRDGEVRRHEQAHARTLGPHAAGTAQYHSATGPDGRTVATAGSIGVDLSPVPGDPRATLRKARVILNAAYAPGDPSAADMRVAAEAYRLAQDAAHDLEAARADSTDTGVGGGW